MIPRPPRSTLPATRFPYTTLFRSPDLFAESCTDHHLRILVLGRPHCGCDGAYPHASARQREIPQPTRLREPRGKRGAFGFRSGVDHHRGGDRAAYLIAIRSRRQIRRFGAHRRQLRLVLPRFRRDARVLVGFSPPSPRPLTASLTSQTALVGTTRV